MATTYYFRDAASGIATADVDKLMSQTRGAGATSKVTNTAATPPRPQVTDGAGGTAISWFTEPLDSVTITPANNVNPTFNVRGLESAMNANATFQVQIHEVDSSGTVVGSVIYDGQGARAELGTTEGALNFAPVAADPINTQTITDGNRLRFRMELDNGSGVTMAAGFTVSFFYDGPTGGASGDSFITFTETITEKAITQVPYYQPMPQLLAQ